MAPALSAERRDRPGAARAPKARPPGPWTRLRQGEPVLVPALWRVLRRRPLDGLLTLGALALVGAIVGNALLNQPPKHPAPLFTAPQPMAAAQPAATAATPPAAPAVAPTPAPPKAAPAPAAAPSPTRVAATGSTSPRRDPIADLLREGAADPSETATVVAVQRALNRLKLGPLAEDGHLGPATRRALERFARDQNVPFRGELDARMKRALARASGVRIE